MKYLPCLLIVLTAFDHRFFGGQAGALSLSIEEIACAIVLYFVFLHAIAARRSAVTLFAVPIPRWPPVGAYVLWLGVGATLNLALFGNADSLHGLKDTFPGLILFVSVLIWARPPEGLDLFHRAVLFALLALVVVSGTQFLWEWPVWNPVDPNAYLKHTFGGVEVVRHPVLGGLGSPNSYAVFLGPLVTLTIGWLAGPQAAQAPLGRLRVPICLAILLAVVLTEAKAAVMLTALGSVASIILTRLGIECSRLKVGLVLLFAMGLGAALLLFVTTPGFLPPGSLGTLVERVLLDRAAIAYMLDHKSVLWLGGGVEGFTSQYGILLGVHNEYLRQGLQGGLPAIALFCAVLLSSAILSTRWIYAMPLVVMALLFLVESAAGSQLQSMMFLVLAASVVARGDRGVREP